MEDIRVMGAGRRQAEMAEINVTSLVDVTFVLLIVFMMTAPFIQGGVDVNLPSTRTAPATAVEGPVISLDTQRRVYIGEDQVPLAQLAAVLEQMHPAGDESPVYLRSDEDVPYGFVVRVMGEIKAAGISDMNLVVEPENQ